jgi:hypothetical protein
MAATRNFQRMIAGHAAGISLMASRSGCLHCRDDRDEHEPCDDRRAPLAPPDRQMTAKTIDAIETAAVLCL